MCTAETIVFTEPKWGLASMAYSSGEWQNQ
jgi:hypothetical protein